MDFASGDTALEEAAAVSAVEPAAVVEDVWEPPHPVREDAAITAAAASAISRLFFINESLLSLFFYERPGGDLRCRWVSGSRFRRTGELLDNLTVKSG